MSCDSAPKVLATRLRIREALINHCRPRIVSHVLEMEDKAKLFDKGYQVIDLPKSRDSAVSIDIRMRSVPKIIQGDFSA